MVATELKASTHPLIQKEHNTGGARRIAAIAVNTFRESVRDRVLYNLIFFVLVLVGASIFISDLSTDQESKFTATLGLSLMLVFGGLIAIFIGVGLVYKEIERRTVYNLLSKPVHRHEFLIGKYLGLCLTLLVNSAVMVIGTEAALVLVNKGFTPIQVSVLAAAYLIYLEMILLVAVAILFSSFSTPMLSALFSFGIYVIGHFSGDLRLAARISDSGATRAVLTGLYYILPNLSNFGFIAEASHGRLVPARMAILATVYALVYVAMLLAASVLIFQKKNFK